MNEKLIDTVAVNSTDYLKFIAEDEEEVKKILKELTGVPCYDREHNHPDAVKFYINGGVHIGDYYPETKTLIYHKSYALRESSDFNEHLVSSEVERAMHMIHTSEGYPDVRGWAKMDFKDQVEYARGFGDKGLDLVISKKNGNWELSRNNRTLDSGRNLTPEKTQKILKQAIQLYG